MDATVVDKDRRTRPSSALRRGVLTLMFIALVCGSVVVALRESAAAIPVLGVLVSVDHRDGGDSGTGLVTVQYINGFGYPAIAQVVMTLSEWPSLDAGTPITVYVRDGRAVDEPDPLVATLPLALVHAAILWLLLLFAVREFDSRSALPRRHPRRAGMVRHE